MPHVNGGGSEDLLASSDEVKVYTEEGGDDEHADGVNDDKTDLVASGEDKSTPIPTSYGASKDTLPLRTQLSPVVNKPADTLTSHDRPLNMGYIVTPYPYPNGTAGHIPVSMAKLVSDEFSCNK
uniref:CTNNB1 binding N-teminal domain-containing protein n=1 Tax=Strigamia maritima TaxID=126957 RepID=T1JK38_STRMM